jgi:hypothetical protein
MNCYNHKGVPAIGLCKSCGKALCENCIAELTNGLACKGKCESRVEMINRMLDMNPQIINAARHQVKTAGVSGLVVGIGFLAFALWSYQEFHSTFMPYFLGLIGIASLVTSGLRLSRRQEYPSAQIGDDSNQCLHADAASPRR